MRLTGLQERGPLLEGVGGAEKDLHGRRPSRWSWGAKEAHHGFVWGLPALAKVADPAGGHEVFPGVGATAGSGHDVIDVEVSDGRAAAAVLALVSVPQHHVLTAEANDGAPHPLVPAQMQYARYAERPPDDWEEVVLVSHRKGAPRGKVVQLAKVIDSERGSPEEEQERAARGGDLDGLKEAVHHEDG